MPSAADPVPNSAKDTTRTTSGGFFGFLEDATRVYGSFEETKAKIDTAKKTTTVGNATLPAPNVATTTAEKPWSERPELIVGGLIVAYLLLKG